VTNEIITKSIEELSSLIKSKQLSPVELTNSVIEQTEKYNGKINAYIAETADAARKTAEVIEKEITNGNYRGPLHGIPLAIKDNLYFKDELTTIGSLIHKNHYPEAESTVVAKLRDAGAIFTGKLNMHEYAYGGTNDNPHFGSAKNPWDLTRIPGGSSGGSGAALAADMTIASVGTDTAGSVRIPASACGVIGLKPTFGKVSKFGAFPLSWSLDHIGPMAKTVKDAAILLEAISGYDEKDPTSVYTDQVPYSSLLNGDVKNMRIGVNEDYFFHMVDSGVEQLVRKAIQTFKELGATIVEVDIPELRHSEYTELITMASEASAIHHENLQKRISEYGNDVRILLELGELIPAVDYLHAQQIRRHINQAFSRVYENVDILISPTLPFTASPIGDDLVTINGEEVGFLEHVIRLTGPGNVTGLPAISVPCGLIDGLPAGLQLMGPAFKEETILNAAYALEKTNPMNGQKPELINP